MNKGRSFVDRRPFFLIQGPFCFLESQLLQCGERKKPLIASRTKSQSQFKNSKNTIIQQEIPMLINLSTLKLLYQFTNLHLCSCMNLLSLRLFSSFAFTTPFSAKRSHFLFNPWEPMVVTSVSSFCAPLGLCYILQHFLFREKWAWGLICQIQINNIHKEGRFFIFPFSHKS